MPDLQLSQPSKARHSFISCLSALLSQVSEEESTSHLKIASGISHASPALSALFHWWAPVSSLMVKGSCAATATATYRVATHPPRNLPLTYRSPSITAFQEPQVITEEGNKG